VAALNVKRLVIEVVQVIVSPPTEPVLLHWSTVPPGSGAESAREFRLRPWMGLAAGR
jgi:hypothetical protein